MRKKSHIFNALITIGLLLNSTMYANAQTGFNSGSNSGTTVTTDNIGIGNSTPDSKLNINSGWSSNNCTQNTGATALKIEWTNDRQECSNQQQVVNAAPIPDMVEMYSPHQPPPGMIGGGPYLDPYFYINGQGNIGLASLPNNSFSVAIGGNTLIENSLNFFGAQNTTSQFALPPTYATLNFQNISGNPAYRLCNTSDNTLQLQLGIDNTSPPIFRIVSTNKTPRVLIGNTQPINAYNTCALGVDGDIVAKRCVVQIANWADDVFDASYQPMKLTDLSSYITANHHLPGVPTTQQVKADGSDVGEMNAILLRKVEELTLYVLQLQKDNETLKKSIKSQKR